MDEDMAAVIDIGARLIGVAVRAEWREAIALHLAISLDHARIVGEFPLPDEIDPAPVFSP